MPYHSYFHKKTLERPWSTPSSPSVRVPIFWLALPVSLLEHKVAEIEQRELDVHRGEMNSDVRKLAEKYRAIFDRDVPDIDQYAADKLILAEIRKVLDDIEKTLLKQPSGQTR